MKTTGVVNGVNVDRLFDTIQAIQETPSVARFTFHATNQWLYGGRNRSTIQDFDGVGRENRLRSAPFTLDADEPPVLLGEDTGPNPAEYVLHALAACLTTSMVYHAAARGIKVESIESTLEGDLDLHGFLGMSDNVRKGYENVRATFRIQADASAEVLSELCRFSPVFGIISKPVPVSIRIDKKAGAERELTAATR